VGDAGGMNLSETGVRKQCPLFISAISGGHIAAARVRREIKSVSVTAGGEHDRIGRVIVDLAGAQIARHDSLGMTIDKHQVEHLALWKHLHRAGGDLATKRLVTTKK